MRACLLLVMAAAALGQAAEWNRTREPFRIFGNTYYVGVEGLTSILITSDAGHVLIDGGLPESAPKIAASIRKLGFRVEDVRAILNSHPHNDHAGGIAELQRASGARVVASEKAAAVLRAGRPGPDDPQFRISEPYPASPRVDLIPRDGKIVAGPLQVSAYSAAGHTPGGTTWTWRSCEAGRCLDVVYADSLTAVSGPEFRFTKNETYPRVLDDFERTFSTLASIPCDILVTPHPGASRLFERAAAGRLVDPGACRAYVDRARKGLADRIASEKD